MVVEAEKKSGIRVIPPLVFVVGIVIAFGVDWFRPLSFGVGAAICWPIAVLFIVAPLVVMPSVFRAFRRADSKYDVRAVPNGLVTDGAFRYSRNPGYLGLILITVGIGIAVDNPWVLLAAIPSTLLVHHSVVLREEAILERKFGEQYLAYKRRVRRWI